MAGHRLNAVHKFDVHFEIPEFYRYALEHEHIDPSIAAAIQLAAWRATWQVSQPAPSLD